MGKIAEIKMMEKSLKKKKGKITKKTADQAKKIIERNKAESKASRVGAKKSDVVRSAAKTRAEKNRALSKKYPKK